MKLKPKQLFFALAFAFPFLAFGQRANVTIRGTVTDTDQQPLL